VQDLHKRSPGKISVQDLYKSSAGKISVRDLLARSLYRSLFLNYKVSWQDLPGKISIGDVLERSLQPISVQALSKSSLGKIYVGDILARLQQISMQCLGARSPKRCPGKIRRRRSGTSCCASPRSRNAHGHFTRSILCGDLQGIGRTRMIPPRLNTGP